MGEAVVHLDVVEPETVVDDLEGELARLQDEGVAITMPMTEEDWGERAFQVRDPNGVIVELLDWNAAAGT